MNDDFEENPAPVVEDVESDSELIDMPDDVADFERRSGYKNRRRHNIKNLYPQAYQISHGSVINFGDVPVWIGLNAMMMKWKGLSPNIVKEQLKTSRSYSVKLIIFVIFFILGFALCFIEIGGNMKTNQTAAIAIWMAALWVTEFIPLVITSLLPIVLFPLFGILPSAAVTANYANDTTFLFMAGVFMAMALERWDLHRRFSMKILSWFGCKPQSIMIGFMVATFILSMFISNTAATLMMIPNATGVLQSLRSTNCDTGDNGDRHSTDQLAKGVLLGIAYAANTGGLASYIGTPTNLVLASQLQAIFPDAPVLNFLKWLKFGLPIGILIAICIWAYLSLQYIRKAPPVEGLDHTFFKKRYADMGPWTREQMIVTSIFFIEICLWISKPGWEILFKDGFVTDTTVGMLMGLMLFIIPAKSRNLSKDAIGYDEDDDDEDEEKPEITTILDWRTANTMPWDIILLLGGGFALAQGFTASGLSLWIGQQLARLGMLPVALILFIFITIVIWLTEVTSNAATASIMVPISASLAAAIKVNPLTFMIPITLACSCAFAFPVATPPNMVVFSTGRIKMIEMNLAGIVLNPLSSLVLLMGAYTFIPWATGIPPESFPSWAANSTMTGVTSN